MTNNILDADVETIPVDKILEGILERINKVQPDYVVCVNNRIFMLIAEYATTKPEWKQALKKFIDVGALNYLSIQDKAILILDGETEFGRTIRRDLGHLSYGQTPKSVEMYSIFLADDDLARQTRNEIATALQNEGQSKLANALRGVKSFQQLNDPEDFHGYGHSLVNHVSENIHRPYNPDAVVFKLSLDGYDITELGKELADYGRLFFYNDFIASLLLEDISFIPKLENCVGISFDRPPVSKIRIFQKKEGVFLISPMVFGKISMRDKFQKMVNAGDINDAQKTFVTQMMDVLKFSDFKDGEKHLVGTYELMRLCYEVVLMNAVRSALTNKGINVSITPGRFSLNARFGPTIGENLYSLLENGLKQQERPAPPINQVFLNPEPPNTYDIFRIKKVCLDCYPSENHPHREGLTSEEISQKCGLDAVTVSMAIDMLCDNAIIKPFLKVNKDLMHVERRYNTDTVQYRPAFARLIDKAAKIGIKTTPFNLQKMTAFLHYIFFPFKNFYIRTIQLGKVVNLPIMNEEEAEYRELEKLLLEDFSDVFERRDTEIVVRQEGRHKVIGYGRHAESRKLDSCLEVMFDQYLAIDKHLTDNPIKGEHSVRRDMFEGFPSFVDLVGYQPEFGIHTISKLITKGLERFHNADLIINKKIPPKKYTTPEELRTTAENFIVNAALHKSRVLYSMLDVFLERYKDLGDRLGRQGDYRREVWKRMGVFPSGSLFLKYFNLKVETVVEDVKKYIQNPTTNELDNLIDTHDPFFQAALAMSAKVPVSLKGVNRQFQNHNIVLFDLWNSGKLNEKKINLEHDLWKHVQNVLKVVVFAWAKYFGAKSVGDGFKGDGIYFSIAERKNLLPFSVLVCVLLNEICETMNACDIFPYKLGARVSARSDEIGNMNPTKDDFIGAPLDWTAKQKSEENALLLLHRESLQDILYPLELEDSQYSTSDVQALDPRILFQKIFLKNF